MVEKIQLPVRYTDDDLPIRTKGIYVIQMPNAIEAGYPVEYKHSHKEWLGIERFGLIKIGITIYNVSDRITGLERIADGYFYGTEWDYPDFECAGFANLHFFRRSYEKWLHHTLYNYRIPQKDMHELGREWFIPTDEVLGFLQDIFNQINASDLNKRESIEELSKRLSRIRQAHFGGMLSAPQLDKGEYHSFIRYLDFQESWAKREQERKQGKKVGGFTQNEIALLDGFFKRFKASDE